MYGDNAGWYSLLEQASNRPVYSGGTVAFGPSSANRRRQPLGNAYGHGLLIEGRYLRLWHPSNLRLYGARFFWMYHNAAGTVARKVVSEYSRAVKAYERSSELEPIGQILFITLPILLRTTILIGRLLYRRSLLLESGIHRRNNYGMNNSLFGIRMR